MATKKEKLKLVKIIIRYKELKTTLTPYLTVDSRWLLLYYNIRCRQTTVTHFFLYHYTEEPQYPRDWVHHSHVFGSHFLINLK